MVRAFTLATALALLSGCADLKNAFYDGPAFCDVQQAYTPPAAEVRTVIQAPYTAQYLVGTNLKGEEFCKWTPPT